MYDKILVPLDGSEISELALPQAAHLAREGGAQLVLLRALITPQLRGWLAIDLVVAHQKEQKAADDYLRERVEQLVSDGVRAVAEVRDGPPAQAIVQSAAQHEVDLIVMSTHGRSGFNRWAFGSVAEKVLRSSQVPLLLVKPQNGRE